MKPFSPMSLGAVLAHKLELLAAKSAPPKAPKGKDAKFAAAYRKAKAAGLVAGDARKPRAMIVTQHANPLDDNSAVEKSWYVAEGACGFAWVNVKPGTSSFAKWLVKNKLADKSYYGGVDIWISEFGQSVERKEACAAAMAEALRNELGAKAYSMSRLD